MFFHQDGDDFIRNFRRKDVEKQRAWVDSYICRKDEFAFEWSETLAFKCIKLAKSPGSIAVIIQSMPHILDEFPLIKEITTKCPYFISNFIRYKSCITKEANESVESLLFRACIDCEDTQTTYHFMRKGFSVIGTDDQYYDWTVVLEGKARCYQAVLTLLGIAKFRKQKERDTLRITARKCWMTRKQQVWEPEVK